MGGESWSFAARLLEGAPWGYYYGEWGCIPWEHPNRLLAAMHRLTAWTPFDIYYLSCRLLRSPRACPSAPLVTTCSAPPSASAPPARTAPTRRAWCGRGVGPCGGALTSKPEGVTSVERQLSMLCACCIDHLAGLLVGSPALARSISTARLPGMAAPAPSSPKPYRCTLTPAAQLPRRRHLQRLVRLRQRRPGLREQHLPGAAWGGVCVCGWVAGWGQAR